MKHLLLPTLLLFAASLGANDYTVTLYTSDCAKPNKFVYADTTTTTLTAVPQDCQQFVRWSDGNTDNPRTITLTSDTTFTAVFAPNCFTITATGEHGTVTGSGTYQQGATATLTATNNDCYSFQKWSDGNTDNPRSVIVTQDSTFIAEFAKQVDSTQIIDVAVYGDCSKNGYTKVIHPSLPNSGTAAVLSSAGRDSCDYVQLWEGGPKWATFNVGATITNYAHLTVGADPIPLNNYKDKASYYNTANLGGLYAWNNPNINGRKTAWNSSVSTGIGDVATTLWGSNWETPTKEQLDTLQNSSYGKTICTWCDGSTTQYVVGCMIAGWKVSGKNAYADKSIFIPAAGYYSYSYGAVFDVSNIGYYWTSSVYDSSNAYTLGFQSNVRNVGSDGRGYGRTLRAVLANNAVPTQTFNLTLNANGCEPANVFVCPKGQQLRITAEPQDCQRFVRWNDGNTDNPRQVVVTQDSTFTAIFVGTGYQETVNCTVVNESPYGTVSFTGTVIKDSNISLKAIAPECSKFVKWSDNDTSNPRSLTVTQDSTLTAIFEKVQFTITTTPDDASHGTTDATAQP